MSCLIELVGPQHAGKSTIVSLMSFALESNGIPTVWAETDRYVFNLFPQYRKLYNVGQNEKASRLLDDRWPFFENVIGAVIQESLDASYVVLHDHVDVGRFKRGADRNLAAKRGARYLGVLVTAPLEVLKARWSMVNFPQRDMEKMTTQYAKFQELREGGLCDIVFDTTVTPPEKAAVALVSAIRPEIMVDIDLSMQTSTRSAFARSGERIHIAGLPELKAGVQVYRESKAYMVVYKHESYMTDEIGSKVMRLCDGSRSVETIARKAKIDPDLVNRVVQFMLKTDMVRLVPPSGPPRRSRALLTRPSTH